MVKIRALLFLFLIISTVSERNNRPVVSQTLYFFVSQIRTKEDVRKEFLWKFHFSDLKFRYKNDFCEIRC